MSWEELDISEKDVEKAKKKHHEQVMATAKNYAHLFSDEFGQKVLQDLVDNFVMNNATEFSTPNIDYVAAYRNGEAGVVHYILNQIKRAQSYD